MHVVGIDLGTTNSVVAVEGDFSEKGKKYGHVTAIADDVGRFTQASALCLVDGQLIVGDDAKDLAAQGYAPVRFAKKYMGTQEKFRVGDEEWTAIQVSTEVLKRMCWMVENALGGKIQNAVVTHPAYFDALAINATKEAAKAAGLNVELMMEPIAAAMAYTFEDNSPQMLVLIYDLGGGTFDVTLVQRTSGMFRPLAFGGNRELGGYNFDKRIATKMLKTLRDKYTLTIDEDKPETDARWASLMHHAEQLKIQLSGAPKAEVRRPGVFRDDSTPPKSVSLAFSITRQEFLELISKELEETIAATREVLSKAGRQPSDVNHLVLVGGSSRIPAIHDRLEKEFGLKPEFNDDILDLSVAVGAAMAASQMGKQEGQVILERIPEQTNTTKLTISGRVVPSEELKDPTDCSVTVRGGASDESTTTSANGGFYLKVELIPDSENVLELLIESPDGQVLLQKTVSVTHDVGAKRPPPPPKVALPKPISVDTESGLEEIAAENVPLPYRNTMAFVTVKELTEIPIDIYQEDIQLSTLILKGFSSAVPANCRVELTLDIAEDYQMKVTASVPTASITKSQDIKLQEPVIPTADELRMQFRQLEGQYRSQLENMPDGDAKARATAECERLVEEIQQLLEVEHPERIQIFMLLKKFHILIRQMSAQTSMKPTKAEFETMLKEARQLLPQALRKQPALEQQEIDKTLTLLENQARLAYQESDPAAWARNTSKVEEIKHSLEHVVSGGGGPKLDDLPDAPVLKMILESSIEELEQTVSAKSGQLPPSTLDRARSELRTARQKLAACDLSRGEQSKLDVIRVYQHIQTAEQLLDKKSSGGTGILRKL